MSYMLNNTVEKWRKSKNKDVKVSKFKLSGVMAPEKQ